MKMYFYHMGPLIHLSGLVLEGKIWKKNIKCLSFPTCPRIFKQYLNSENSFKCWYVPRSLYDNLEQQQSLPTRPLIMMSSSQFTEGFF